MQHFLIYLYSRIWPHRTQNAYGKSHNDLLCYSGHPFDAALPLKHRRHHGQLVPVTYFTFQSNLCTIKLTTAVFSQTIIHAAFSSPDPVSCTGASVALSARENRSATTGGQGRTGERFASQGKRNSRTPFQSLLL